MRVYDLTHTVRTGMPVYPGTEPPTVTPAATLARDGYRETAVSLWSHVGTHMDAPAHLLAEGTTLDRLPPERFMGPAALLDCRGQERVTPETAETLPLSELRFVILRTGWEERFGAPSYFAGYPRLTPEAAQRLAAAGLYGVGIDAPSVDPVGVPLTIHRILLGAGLVILENLRGLDALPARFELLALPLRIGDADGAPARVLARAGAIDEIK